MSRKKSPRQLDREIAASLSARGQPSLAAMFADPEARKVFAQEMRRELNLKEAARRNAATFAAYPYTVKKAGEGIVNNYKTEAEAVAKAKAIGGWVETRAGKAVYGSRP